MKWQWKYIIPVPLSRHKLLHEVAFLWISLPCWKTIKLLVKWLSSWHQWREYCTRLIKSSTLQIFTNTPLINEFLARFQLYILCIYVVWGWQNEKHNPYVNCFMIYAKHSVWNRSELEIEAILKGSLAWFTLQVGWYGCRTAVDIY